MTTSPNDNDWMEQLAKRMFALLVFALLVFMLLITFSCGSKKKLMQKTNFSTEIATVERVSEKEEKEVKTDIETKGSTKTEIEKEGENFQAEIDDPTKKATVTKKEKDGETAWEFENIKNFSSGKEKSKESTKDSIGQKLSKIDKSKTTSETENEAKAKATGSDRNVDVAIKKGFPWWWIIIAIIVYGVISYFRGLNPLNWLK